jgi:hypothetical protein
MSELYGIGDSVSFVSVHGEEVVKVTGTVVGLAAVGGLAFVKVNGIEEWQASAAVRLVDNEARRLP